MKMKKGSKQTEQTKVTGKVLHHVTILDASGSMSGGKYTSATVGINEGIKALINDKSGVEHRYTIVEFSGGGWGRNHTQSTKQHGDSTPIKNFKWEPMGSSGSTPLVATTTEVLNKLMSTKSKDEPAIVNIFTDGGETDGGDWSKLKHAIDAAEKDHMITITFRGTAQDTAHIQSRLDLKAGNTLVHDNTTRGVAESFDITTKATLRFTKSYASGASVNALSQNFYTRTEEDVKNKK